MQPIHDPSCVTVEVELALPLHEARRALTQAMLEGAPIESVTQEGRTRLTARTGPWYMSQEQIVVEMEEIPSGTRAWVTSQDFASSTEEFLSANADNVSRIVSRLPATSRPRAVEPRHQRPALEGWHYAVVVLMLLLMLGLAMH